ncbi:DUF6222 family protein [Amycolatopsis sp. NPDC058986]|uniref:DUF6222 family protein n=1 Tax=unclassified Amycolatopsis TaxID=2618356 RepID=UPI0036718524
MTTNEARDTGVAAPEQTAVLVPMPRLGRGIRWSDILAEIERDNRARSGGDERVRDAA